MIHRKAWRDCDPKQTLFGTVAEIYIAQLSYGRNDPIVNAIDVAGELLDDKHVVIADEIKTDRTVDPAGVGGEREPWVIEYRASVRY